MDAVRKMDLSPFDRDYVAELLEMRDIQIVARIEEAVRRAKERDDRALLLKICLAAYKWRLVDESDEAAMDHAISELTDALDAYADETLGVDARLQPGYTPA